MTQSVTTPELNLDPSRIPAEPSTTVLGTVNKIIPSPLPSQPEKAQIAIEGADHRYRDLRIENSLGDEHGGGEAQKACSRGGYRHSQRRQRRRLSTKTNRISPNVGPKSNRVRRFWRLCCFAQ